MRKLLILGGANMHCKLVTAAREMGIYTIVTDYIKDSPAKLIADKSYDIDVKDVESIVDMCLKEGVNAVLATHIDPCQRPYFEICKRLGFYCYIDNEYQLTALTDKNVVKSECQRAGLDIIETYSLDEDDKICYPVLVKPACSRGSRAQNVCYDQTELSKALKISSEASSDGNAIIEKYMEDAQDFTITYIYADGKPFLERIGDRYMGPLKSGMESVVSSTVCPSLAYDHYKKNLEPKVFTLLENLQIKNGPVFFQAFLDGDKLRMYDPGYRFPGCEYETGLKAATGTDAIKIMIEFAFTGKMQNEYFTLNDDTALLNGKVQAVFFSFSKNGILEKYEGLDKTANEKWLIYQTQRYKPGDEIEYTRDVRQQIAEFSILTDNRAELAEAIAEINKEFKALDTEGNNLIFDKMDEKRVLNIGIKI